jgi:restriction endonuclease Mrr
MALRELNVRNLTPDEAQQALDRAREYKKMKIPDLEQRLEQTQKLLALVQTKLNEDFAREILKAIKEYHPELLKEAL